MSLEIKPEKPKVRFRKKPVNKKRSNKFQKEYFRKRKGKTKTQNPKAIGKVVWRRR